MPLVGILIKFLAPIFLFYMFQKWLRNTLNPSNDNAKNFEADSKRRGSPRDQVIEICPECGNVMLPKHKCQYNS